MYPPRILLKRAVDAACSGATVVTPTEQAARTVRHACDALMLSSGKAWHTPRVLSWGAFVNWLWREVLMTGDTDRVLLSRDQQRVLWEEALGRSAEGGRLMNPPGAATQAKRAWKQIHAYRIPFPSAVFDRSPETKAFAAWATDVSRTFEHNGWTDGARAADQLVRLAGSLRRVLTSLVAYGFDELTPQQHELLQAGRGAGIPVEQLAYSAQLRLDGSAEREHVRLFVANDQQDEVRRAATWARNKLCAKPAAQIGVVIPQLSDVRVAVGEIFTEVLHPEFFFPNNTLDQVAFDIVATGRLSDEGLVDTAVRGLRLATGALPLEEACRLVRSPYLLDSREERASRAEFDLALRRCPLPQINALQLLDEARKAKCSALTKQLATFGRTCAPFAEQYAPGKWAQHVSAALTAIGWPGDLMPEEYEVHEAFLEVLRRFSALEVVRPAKLTAAQAVNEISRMAREQRFRRKSAACPIQVLDLSDTVGVAFDYLWICGMTDDIWPPRGASNPFIPPSLQLQYGLPHSSVDADNEAASRLLARLYASAAEVSVSWPKREKDRELRPAPQVANLAVSVQEVSEPVAARVTELFAVAEPEFFYDEQAPAATSGLQPGGTKVFEYQSTCPFRAFADKRLMARKIEDAYAGPSYIDRGKLIERVLQRAWDDLVDWQRLNAVFDTFELAAIIERAVDVAIAENIKQPGRWLDNFRIVERARLIKVAQNWFALERQRSPFGTPEHQKKIEITIGSVTVEGCIDRLDRLPSGDLVIIDYKSGDNFNVRMWELPRMSAPQLPLYAVAQPGSVAAVAFGVARTSRCELVGYTRAKEHFGKTGNGSHDMGHEIGKWREELESLAAAYLAGDAKVDPKILHKTCRFCHIGPLCRVKEQAPPEIAEEAGDDDQ